MNRYKLVRKATDAAEAADGHLSPRYRYKRAAEAVVDFLLPQVTTVEELEALPLRSFVIDGDGIGWERGMDGWYSPGVNYSKMTRYVADQGPLTVVWQP